MPLRKFCAHSDLFIDKGYSSNNLKYELLIDKLENCNNKGHCVILFTTLIETMHKRPIQQIYQ